MKYLGVALERIYPNSIVCIENGLVREATSDEIRDLRFPDDIDKVRFMIEKDDLLPPAPAVQDDNKALTAPRFEVTIRRNSEADKTD